MTPIDLIQILIFSLVIGGIYAIVAIGLNLIFGVMNVLNVAHGDLLMLSAYGTFWLLTIYNVDPLLSIVLMGPTLFLLGSSIYKFIVHRIIERSSSITEIVFTSLLIFFGLSIFIENSALLAWKADFRSVRYLEGQITIFGIPLSEKYIITLVFVLLTTLIIQFFLTRTYLGKAIRAAAQNRMAAMLMGIRLDRVNILSFGMGAALTAIAGTLVIINYPIYPSIGVAWTMRALAISVIGGLGSFSGALMGAFIIGLAESFGSYFIGSAWRDAISYAVLILVILLRPSGILGRGE